MGWGKEEEPFCETQAGSCRRFESSVLARDHGNERILRSGLPGGKSRTTFPTSLFLLQREGHLRKILGRRDVFSREVKLTFYWMFKGG